MGIYIYLGLQDYKDINIRIYKYMRINVFVNTYYKVYRYLEIKKQSYIDIDKYRDNEIKV